jgi:HK97 family phage major capsid protein
MTAHAQVLQELGNAFQDFKAKYDAELDELKKVVARSEFPGLTGGSFDGANLAEKKEHAQAFDKFFRKGVDAGLRDLEIKAALSTTSDPDGGFGVPEEIDSEIEKLETDSVAMRRVARIKKITTSDYKKLVSVGGTEAGWVGEHDARAETSTPELAQVAPTIGEIYANPGVTQVALDDIAFDAGEWLVEEVSSVFADKEGEAFITGNGVGKPRGILSYPTTNEIDSVRAWGTLQYVAGGHASLLNNADKLIDVVHSLRAKYRRGASWLMNSQTIAVVRKLKNGDGDYIWSDSLKEGQPNTLLGYPVEEEDFMPSISADQFPIAFGNFQRGYLIVDRIGVRVLRDPYSVKGKVFFYTTKRLGGACQNFQAIKLLKVATS